MPSPFQQSNVISNPVFLLSSPLPPCSALATPLPGLLPQPPFTYTATYFPITLTFPDHIFPSTSFPLNPDPPPSSSFIHQQLGTRISVTRSLPACLLPTADTPPPLLPSLKPSLGLLPPRSPYRGITSPLSPAFTLPGGHPPSHSPLSFPPQGHPPPPSSLMGSPWREWQIAPRRPRDTLSAGGPTPRAARSCAPPPASNSRHKGSSSKGSTNPTTPPCPSATSRTGTTKESSICVPRGWRPMGEGPLIGVGAFGSVYRCLSLSSGAILAVKSCSCASPQRPDASPGEGDHAEVIPRRPAFPRRHHLPGRQLDPRGRHRGA